MDFTLNHVALEVAASAIFVAVMVGLRSVMTRMVTRNSEILTREQRRWVNRIKSATIVILAFALIMIWAPQLRTFALSLTALLAALLVVSKEIILCLIGSLFRISTQPYKVGDWITIGNVTGEVMETNAFVTRLEEIDLSRGSYQFTGMSISMPNSLLFTTQVANHNFIKSYVYRTLELTVPSEHVNPTALWNRLRLIVEDHIAPHKEASDKFVERINRRVGIDMPGAEPVYGFHTTDFGHYVFTAKIFLPTATANRLAAAISEDFLSFAYDARTGKEKTASA